MSLNARDVDLMDKATKYSLENTLKKRLKRLVENSPRQDKIETALEYAHSVTKCEIRGT